MKYECEVIRDLLPLYQDGVCSDKSRKIVEEHLSECIKCTEYSHKMSNALPELAVPVREFQAAESFKSVRRRITRGKLIAAAVSVIVVIGILFTAVQLMYGIKRTIEYKNDNITVSMQDGGLIGRARGTWVSGSHIKNVAVDENNEQSRRISFVCLYESVGAAVFTKKDSFSEFTVAYSDKGADRIDAVYYYTGSLDELDCVTPETLAAITEKSVLLWKRRQ